MTKSELDELIETLGEPVPVETTGPSEPEDTEGDQDVVDPVYGLMSKTGDVDDGKTVRGVKGAIAWGRQQMIDRVSRYKGLCLMFVRMCFNVDPLYPDAITAWEQNKARRRCTAKEARRGHAGFFRGGQHGHVVLCLGNGRCLTNDTGAPGTINVAMIADIERAWGYVFLGDAASVNGEVAPAPKKRNRLTNRQWRLLHLRNARSRARQAGNTRRVARLTEWITAIEGRK